MATTIQRDFTPADRYLYNFNKCSYANGWAQIDTEQDAIYYGQWINPERRLIFAYVEGDCILTKCETDADLQSEMFRMKEWNVKQGWRFMGIDPGFNEALKTALITAGLEQYLH